MELERVDASVFQDVLSCPSYRHVSVELMRGTTERRGLESFCERPLGYALEDRLVQAIRERPAKCIVVCRTVSERELN